MSRGHYSTAHEDIMPDAQNRMADEDTWVE